MVVQLHSHLAKIGSKQSIHLIRKNISCFSYLFGSKKSQEKSCLPNCFTINIPQVTEDILSPTTFVTKWRFIGYDKTSVFFWLIISVSSPPSLITMRFPHSSLINTSLGESSKFTMSSISMQSSSATNIIFSSEELLFLMEP